MKNHLNETNKPVDFQMVLYRFHFVLQEISAAFYFSCESFRSLLQFSMNLFSVSFFK